MPVLHPAAERNRSKRGTVKHKAILVAALILAGEVFAGAQETVPWRLVFLNIADPDATAKINNHIRDGLMPVGLEVTPGESLGVLLVRAGARNVRNWAILDYDDWNALESEITGGITDGYVPMDISRYRDTLAVLWVGTDLEIEGWRVSTSRNTIAERTRTINEFQSQGFTLWGFSVNDDLAWYLFLRTPGTPPAGAVSGFRDDSALIQEGMAGASQAGWLPNGLARDGETVYVCFVR